MALKRLTFAQSLNQRVQGSNPCAPTTPSKVEFPAAASGDADGAAAMTAKRAGEIEQGLVAARPADE